MTRKIKFKNDKPVKIWIGSRGGISHAADEIIKYTDSSSIEVYYVDNYKNAIDSIYEASMYMSEANLNKYMFGIIPYLDDTDEDVFFFLLTPYDEWYKFLDY